MDMHFTNLVHLNWVLVKIVFNLILAKTEVKIIYIFNFIAEDFDSSSWIH